MASTASAGLSSPSSSAYSSGHAGHEEAGPLPLKAGELGYSSAAATIPASEPVVEADVTDVDVDGRHPVERARDAPAAVLPRTPTTGSGATSSDNEAASQSTTSLPVKALPWYQRVYSSKAGPLVGGLRGPTLVKFIVILLVIGGMSGAWAVSTIRVSVVAKTAEQKSDKNMLNTMASYMGVFIHVAFAIAMLVLLVVLERTFFLLRAERWVHTHPGETLPLHRGGADTTRTRDVLSSAPWNRPPLPTYAAALGIRGTGDVEDDAIAAPPPPAYGNTRGSVLLLASSVMRRLSGGTSSNRLSQLRSPLTPRTPREFQQIPESRPVSYISNEGLGDIARAHELEMSLARLEGGAAAVTASSDTNGPIRH